MSRAAGANLLIVALGALCVVLLGAAAAPWLVDPLDHIGGAVPAGGTEAAPAVATPRLDAPPAESLALLIERPLFTATRRPPPPTDLTAPATATPQPDASLILGRYRLSGIVVTPDHRLVLLTPKGSGDTIGVAKGEMLDDWKVTEVEREFIVFERGTRKKTYIVRDTAEIENSTD